MYCYLMHTNFYFHPSFQMWYNLTYVALCNYNCVLHTYVPVFNLVNTLLCIKCDIGKGQLCTQEEATPWNSQWVCAALFFKS